MDFSIWIYVFGFSWCNGLINKHKLKNYWYESTPLCIGCAEKFLPQASNNERRLGRSKGEWVLSKYIPQYCDCRLPYFTEGWHLNNGPIIYCSNSFSCQIICFKRLISKERNVEKSMIIKFICKWKKYYVTSFKYWIILENWDFGEN